MDYIPLPPRSRASALLDVMNDVLNVVCWVLLIIIVLALVAGFHAYWAYHHQPASCLITGCHFSLITGWSDN